MICLFKNVFTDDIQRFPSGTCQITLGRIYNLECHPCQAKTFYKQRSLIVNDPITASFLFFLLIVNHSVPTENVLVQLNVSFT